MADIVNLNTFRKAKARTDKEVRAQRNRVEFGTPKALKDLEAAKTAQKTKKHDGKKLDSEDEDGPSRD